MKFMRLARAGWALALTSYWRLRLRLHAFASYWGKASRK
jgi:hypothetical protein